jgi:hypothetical protein
MTRATILFLLLASTAHGQVVVNENIRAAADRYAGIADDTELWLWVSVLPDHGPHSPCYGPGCWSYVGLDQQGGLVSSDHSLFAGDWRVASTGELFNDVTIESFPRVISGYHPVDNPPVFVGDDFYLAFTTIQTWGQFPTTGYGWVHLVDEGGTLRMLSNAIAYGASGIVVGAPEPSTIGLALMTLTQWPARRRPKESRTRPASGIVKYFVRYVIGSAWRGKLLG